MIGSYGDEATEDIHLGYNTKSARSLPSTIWPAARRKLDVLGAAASLATIGRLPGTRLEKLRGELAGWYSIRINDQWRIVFQFSDVAGAMGVQIVDYH